MATGIKISELDSANELQLTDKVELSQPLAGGGFLSKSATLEQLGAVFNQNAQLKFVIGVNGREISVGNSNVMVVRVQFDVVKDIDVDAWSEIKINTTFNEGSSRIVAYITYRHNGTEMSRIPIETWGNDGYHTLNLGYHIPMVEAAVGHRWEVFIRLEGGTGIVERNSATTVLTVLGSSSEQHWDGTIGYEIAVPEVSTSIKTPTIIGNFNIDNTILDGMRFFYTANIPNYVTNIPISTIIEKMEHPYVTVYTLDYVLRCGEDFYDEGIDPLTSITGGGF